MHPYGTSKTEFPRPCTFTFSNTPNLGAHNGYNNYSTAMPLSLLGLVYIFIKALNVKRNPLNKCDKNFVTHLLRNMVQYHQSMRGRRQSVFFLFGFFFTHRDPSKSDLHNTSVEVHHGTKEVSEKKSGKTLDTGSFLSTNKSIMVFCLIYLIGSTYLCRNIEKLALS